MYIVFNFYRNIPKQIDTICFHFMWTNFDRGMGFQIFLLTAPACVHLLLET